jgi:hypothetical protein
LYQSLYSTVNSEGFLETPALIVHHTATPDAALLTNKIAKKDIYKLSKSGKPTKTLLVKEDNYITAEIAKEIANSYQEPILTRPYITDEVVYISPEMDEKVTIADAASPVDEHGNITVKRVAGRHFTEMEMFHISDITHIDVNPSQIFSANT